MAKKTLFISKIWIILLVFSGPIFAEEVSPISIFGSQDETRQAGSAHFIGDDEMKRNNYTDAERILNRIPGVYSQTEDGYGLRNNIGMRGTSALRTTKINILEDGVPQGPAIYSNGSMYFFPDVGRMEGVEVLKGAAAIGNGPRTTAGTINFISRSVPTKGVEGHYSLTFGDDGFSRNHMYYGGNLGNLGYVIEYSDHRADGYKSIKGTSNPGDTGYDKQTDLFKLRYSMPQSQSYLEFTSSNTTETSNETYVGLTTAAFHADPYQRYAETAFDQMDNDYHRYILTHFKQWTPNLAVTTKLYKTRYSRLWGKVGDIYVDPEANGVGSTTKVKFSAIDMADGTHLAGSNELRAYNILTGTTAMGANEYIKRYMGHRDYGMTGFQMVFNHNIGSHDLEYGYRRHKDYRERHDADYYEKYTVDANNTMTMVTPGGAVRGATTTSAAELKDTDAVSIYLKDTFTMGNFTNTIGIRKEDTENNDGTNANPGNSKQDISRDETMMGLSTIYNLGGGASWFVGYSQGFSPVDAGTAASVEPEESDVWEIGYRKQTANSFLELIAFSNHYDQLNETCLAAAGCTDTTGTTYSKGAAEIEGIEFQYRLNNMFSPPRMKGGATAQGHIRFPLLISGMLQDSEYTGQNVSYRGNSVAYVPDFQLYTSVGAETNNWDISLGAKYLDDTFTNDDNTYRTGKAFIFDLHSGMKIPPLMAGIKSARAFINVDNLFDKVIVASEHEYGKRPNKPLTFMAGVKFDF